MRVVLIDDHPLFRAGLRALLEGQRVEVVGEGETGRAALELARRLQPDLVLLDLNMPEMDGLTATRLLSAEQPQVKVVILTASDEDADLFEAIKAGAQGYLLKNLQPVDLVRHLESVARGEPALTPGLARKLLTEFARPSATRRTGRGDPEALTEREQEVLELLVQGVTGSHDLADRLVVTENTVKYHLRNILAKLHLQNRAQVVAYAMSHGLVPPPRPSPEQLD